MAARKQAVARKVALVRLRDHPKIHWPPGGEPNPPWVGPGAEFPDPFQVVLTNVELVEGDKHVQRHLTLSGTYHGNPYRTTMTVGDASVLINLCKSLGKCVGETVREIGSHAVDRSLRLA